MTKLEIGELYEKIERLSLYLTSVHYPHQELMKREMLKHIREIVVDYRDTFNIVKAIDLYHPSNNEVVTVGEER